MPTDLPALPAVIATLRHQRSVQQRIFDALGFDTPYVRGTLDGIDTAIRIIENIAGTGSVANDVTDVTDVSPPTDVV